MVREPAPLPRKELQPPIAHRGRASRSRWRVSRIGTRSVKPSPSDTAASRCSMTPRNRLAMILVDPQFATAYVRAVVHLQHHVGQRIRLYVAPRPRQADTLRVQIQHLRNRVGSRRRPAPGDYSAGAARRQRVPRPPRIVAPCPTSRPERVQALCALARRLPAPRMARSASASLSRAGSRTRPVLDGRYLGEDDGASGEDASP